MLIPEDGCLPKITSTGLAPFNNIMIIKVPEHLRKEGETIYQFATLDRSKQTERWPADKLIDDLNSTVENNSNFSLPASNEKTGSNEQNKSNKLKFDPKSKQSIFHQHKYKSPIQESKHVTKDLVCETNIYSERNQAVVDPNLKMHHGEMFSVLNPELPMTNPSIVDDSSLLPTHTQSFHNTFGRAKNFREGLLGEAPVQHLLRTDTNAGYFSHSTAPENILNRMPVANFEGQRTEFPEHNPTVFHRQDLSQSNFEKQFRNRSFKNTSEGPIGNGPFQNGLPNDRFVDPCRNGPQRDFEDPCRKIPQRDFEDPCRNIPQRDFEDPYRNGPLQKDHPLDYLSVPSQNGPRGPFEDPHQNGLARNHFEDPPRKGLARNNFVDPLQSDRTRNHFEGPLQNDTRDTFNVPSRNNFGGPFLGSNYDNTIYNRDVPNVNYSTSRNRIPPNIPFMHGSYSNMPNTAQRKEPEFFNRNYNRDNNYDRKFANFPPAPYNDLPRCENERDFWSNQHEINSSSKPADVGISARGNMNRHWRKSFQNPRRKNGMRGRGNYR